MILLLGASGYIGRAFASELQRRGHSFIPLTRGAFDYTRFDFLFDYLRTMRPLFLINCAGYSAETAVSQAERQNLMAANAILPQMIARVCSMTKTPWGHVSSGSIYTGAKVIRNGKVELCRDLSEESVLDLFHHRPECFRGFSEFDEPNFTFRNSPCNFYSGTKALAEETIRDITPTYIWRLRLPFNYHEENCNWLSRMRYEPALSDSVNSFSHLDDCVKACLDLWEYRAPFGIYNVTNPGALSGRQIAMQMRRVLRIDPELLEDSEARTPVSNCILDTSKLLSMGIKLRPIDQAMDHCFERLRIASRNAPAIEQASRIVPVAAA